MFYYPNMQKSKISLSSITNNKITFLNKLSSKFLIKTNIYSNNSNKILLWEANNNYNKPQYLNNNNINIYNLKTQPQYPNNNSNYSNLNNNNSPQFPQSFTIPPNKYNKFPLPFNLLYNILNNLNNNKYLFINNNHSILKDKGSKVQLISNLYQAMLVAEQWCCSLLALNLLNNLCIVLIRAKMYLLEIIRL